MKSKLISALLVWALLCVSVIPVGATGTAIPLSGSVTLAEKTISVTLSLHGNSGVESGSFAFIYDPTLTLQSAGSPLTIQDLNTTEPGIVTFAWTEDAPAEDTVILTMTFTDTEKGVYDFCTDDLCLWDGTFGSIQAQALQLSITVACDGLTDCPSLPFRDTDQTQWYHEAVDYVLEEGIMVGMGGNLFAPNSTLTRAMVVKVLGALENISPEAFPSSSFKDVQTTSWYAPYVQWAHELGLVKGIGGGLFAPNAPITRQELATILYRYWQYKGNTWTPDNSAYLTFADTVEVAPWAVNAMVWATGMGLVDGVGNDLLAPTELSTRAQMAKMIMLYMSL